MESAYQRTPQHREATDVIAARSEVRTPSAAGQPPGGRLPQMPHRMDAPERRDAVPFGGTGSMFRSFSRLNVTHRGGSAPDGEPAEPSGLVRSAVGDHGSATANPAVTAEELTILTLMANGLTLDSVAIRVAMSPRTLSRRLRCVCDRLGVAHPIQAIVWAAHQGLI
jgi:DNA-binding NarL/FixJ family response regulator